MANANITLRGAYLGLDHSPKSSPVQIGNTFRKFANNGPMEFPQALIRGGLLRYREDRYFVSRNNDDVGWLEIKRRYRFWWSSG